MTRKEALCRLHQILSRRRDSLRRTLHGELEQFNTMAERVVGDLADLAVETDYGTINSQLAEVESRELEQIEHALERFREQQYGICESCERSISLSRLRALPYATMCIGCQRQSEREPSSDQPQPTRRRIHSSHRLGSEVQPSGVLSS